MREDPEFKILVHEVEPIDRSSFLEESKIEEMEEQVPIKSKHEKKTTVMMSTSKVGFLKDARSMHF